jgi:hypothetical protein
MGRYYNGDIQGKFMFAVQSSDAADRFGSLGYTPDVIHYHFDEEHLPKINAELKKLKDAYDKVAKLYADDKIVSVYDEPSITHQDLIDYADYNLGNQIKQCVEDNGYCFFESEL